MPCKIIIDTNRCKGCGLCVQACPKGCIIISRLSNKTGYFPAEAKNNECSGCVMCALVCPETIIEVFRAAQSIVDVKQEKKNKSNLTREKV